MKIAHIVNPVNLPSTSQLSVAQPITFKSIQQAKEYSKALVGVTLYSAQFKEDRNVVWEDFTMTTDLDRSILNLGKFQKPRKLPLLKDILSRLYENSDADYFVYSNVDIAVVPHFYASIYSIINMGYDCFTINRRDLPNSFSHPDELPLMVGELGISHPGHDCFIFKRSLYPHFSHCDACIGIRYIGKYLFFNFLAVGQNFKTFENLHLTFHIGSDRSWNHPVYRDYEEHNVKELRMMLEDLGGQHSHIWSHRIVKKFMQSKPGKNSTRSGLLRIIRKIKRTGKKILNKR